MKAITILDRLKEQAKNDPNVMKLLQKILNVVKEEKKDSK